MGHSEREGIVLVGEQNEAILIRTAALVMALEAAGERIKLVVLNSCKSMETARSGRCLRVRHRDETENPRSRGLDILRTFYRGAGQRPLGGKAFDQGKAAGLSRPE